MSDDKIAVRVTRELYEDVLTPFAKAHGLTLVEAACRLMSVGHNRLGALSRYAADKAKSKKKAAGKKHTRKPRATKPMASPETTDSPPSEGFLDECLTPDPAL